VEFGCFFCAFVLFKKKSFFFLSSFQVNGRSEDYPAADRLFWLLFNHPRVKVWDYHNAIDNELFKYHFMDLITDQRGIFMKVNLSKLASNERGIVLTPDILDRYHCISEKYLDAVAAYHPELKSIFELRSEMTMGEMGNAITSSWQTLMEEKEKKK